MRKLAVVVSLVFFLALGFRLFGLGSFMTADEAQWMIRGGEFWDALLAGNPGGTFLTTHPGATAMWLIGAGVTAQEQLLGFSIDTSNLRYFRLAATLPIAVATSFLIGLIVFLMNRLWGLQVAFMSGILLAVEPYALGLSQIAHLDALLAFLMLSSLLTFFVAVRRPERPWVWAGLSGVLGGLALGTKLLPALWLPAFLGLILVAGWRTWRRMIMIGLVGFGVMGITFFAVWPALWVKDDIGRSFQRDVPSVVVDAHIGASEAADEVGGPRSFYIRTLLARTTPLVLILSVTSLFMLWRAARRSSEARWLIWLVMYAAGFGLVITFIAKQSDRYLLPALVTLPIVAGYMLAHFFEVIVHYRQRFRVVPAVVIGLAVLHTALGLPYSLAYANPLFSDLRPLHQQGWGEGLELAAEWLNNHPLADRLTVASWYPSIMETYFRGKATSLSARDDNRVGYVVLYRNMGDRAQDSIASDVLDEFASQQPEHVISLFGQPYALIYNTLGLRYFPRHVGELTGDLTVGQLVPVFTDTWSTVDIGFATFSGRANSEDVILHIRADQDSTSDIRTVRVNAAELVDGEWHRFTFEPITGASGKTFFIFLSSPDSIPGNAVTVRYVDRDFLPGEMVWKGVVRSELDLAYRITERSVENGAR